MARSVTVRLPDGSSHVYDDVPDEIGDDQVRARASQDFPDRMSNAQGATPSAAQVNIAPQAPDQNAPTFAQYSTLPTSAGQIASAAMVPIQMAAEHPYETGAGIGLYKAGQVGNAYIQGKNLEKAALDAQTAQKAATEARIAGGGAYGRNIPAVPAAGPIAPTPQIVGANGQPISAPQPHTTAVPVQTAQAVAQPAEQGLVNTIRNKAASMVTGLAQANPMLATAGRVAGKILPGAGAALGGLEAYNRAGQGDYLGAGLAGLGGAASFVPGVGTAINMGTTAINAGRDYSAYLAAKRKYEEQQKAMKR